MNYYAINDPLLFLVPSANKALRSGFLVGIQGQHEPEFVFLSPRDGNPVVDHGLMGPTYMEALKWEGRRFQSQYESRSSRLAKTSRTSVDTFIQILARYFAAPIYSVVMVIFYLITECCEEVYLKSNNGFLAVIVAVKVVIRAIGECFEEDKTYERILN